MVQECPKVERFQKYPPLSTEEIELIFSEAKHRGSLADTSLFTLVISTGARLGEIIQLRTSDLSREVDSDGDVEVTIQYGKRKSPINWDNAACISDYLDFLDRKNQEELFPDITEFDFRNLMASYRRQTGIKQLNYRRMQHTFIDCFGGRVDELAVRLGMGIGYLQRILKNRDKARVKR